MLHRFLFVAGMTVGVMVPLVWAAYVSRPASHAEHTLPAKTAEVIPERPKPAQKPTKDVTAAIPPAPAVALAPPKTAHVTPRPKLDAPPQASTPSPAKPTAKTERPHSKTVLAARRTQERTRPAVVDSYNGAHIITVCAALTADEQLGAGCP